MHPPAPSRGLVFGRGLAVLAGWNGLLIAATVLWWLTLSDAPPPADCEDGGWGFNCSASDQQNTAVLLLFVGVPALAGTMLLGIAVVAGLAAARARPGILVGTVAAFTSWLTAAGLVVSG